MSPTRPIAPRPMVERRPAAAPLPAVVHRARPATTSAQPVLRASRSPMQLSLPFFAPLAPLAQR